MKRERVLQVVLILTGCLFLASSVGLFEGLRRPDMENMNEAMLASVYTVLGAFVLMAVRNPQAHRSLLMFVVWSNLAHGATMLWQAIAIPAHRQGLLVASGLFLVIAAALAILMPARKGAAEIAPAVRSSSSILRRLPGS